MHKALIRLLGGIDTSGGVLIFVITSVAFQETFSCLFFLLTITAAHSPDGDFIPYLLLKKRLRYRSHHIIGHHPVILVPIAAGIGWLIGQWYGFTLAISAIILHFIHDSTQIPGIHWFSPFSWRQISLHKMKPRLVPEKERIQFLENLGRRWDEGDGEILGRLQGLTKGEMIFCALSWTALAIFVAVK